MILLTDCSASLVLSFSGGLGGGYRKLLWVFLLSVFVSALVSIGVLVAWSKDTVFWMSFLPILTVSGLVDILGNSPTDFDNPFECVSRVRAASGLSCSGVQSTNTYRTGRSAEVAQTNLLERGLQRSTAFSNACPVRVRCSERSAFSQECSAKWAWFGGRDIGRHWQSLIRERWTGKWPDHTRLNVVFLSNNAPLLFMRTSLPETSDPSQSDFRQNNGRAGWQYFC